MTRQSGLRHCQCPTAVRAGSPSMRSVWAHGLIMLVCFKCSKSVRLENMKKQRKIDLRRFLRNSLDFSIFSKFTYFGYFSKNRRDKYICPCGTHAEKPPPYCCFLHCCYSSKLQYILFKCNQYFIMQLA